MNEQAQNRFKIYLSIVMNYRDHLFRKGVNYGKAEDEAEKKLTAWIKEKCPGASEFDIEELICDCVMAKEDEIMRLLADLEAIKVDFNKLPKMKMSVSPSQININNILDDIALN